MRRRQITAAFLAITVLFGTLERCVEPVTAAFVGVLAFGEPMRAGVALGLGCILLCVFILK